MNRDNNNFVETETILNLLVGALKERDLLKNHFRSQIISYKFSLDGEASSEYLHSLDALSAEQLIETSIQLETEYKRRLEEGYGVNPHQKI